MNTESRLLVFGLDRRDSAADVLLVLGRCGEPRLDLCDVPGADDQVFAVVHLHPDPTLARRLAQRVNDCRLHGRRLQAWVPAMPWN
ncbi:hypothetical protein [Ideonella sp. A 288]|uniref:hypothetical protein n=1 Tax=Ideonella sp. A 288 TaxID=1962181 RepID=UPI000B4B7CAE|nr:hypothetical protein [Ideonella sp. A 288]